MARETLNRPHLVRRDRSLLFSCRTGNKGRNAIGSTAPYAYTLTIHSGIPLNIIPQEC